MKKISDLGKLLSKHEQKSIVGGYDCIQEQESNCSLTGHGNPEDQCCSGLTCEVNGTETGTICQPS